MIIHCGDCSTECDTCARQCAEVRHVGCTGTVEQRRRGDKALEG